MYDKTQFYKDLKSIMFVFAKTRQKGFYTERYVPLADNLEIVGFGDNILFHGSVAISADDIKQNQAELVMKKAMEAEEIIDSGPFTVKFVHQHSI